MPVNRIAKLGLVNAYLVVEDDGLTLVDTMLPRSRKQILAIIGPFARSFDHGSLVFRTHLGRTIRSMHLFWRDSSPSRSNHRQRPTNARCCGAFTWT